MQRVGYCTAHGQCFQLGKLRNKTGCMVGKKQKQIILEPGMPSTMWINFHALISQNSAFGQKSWIYGDVPKSVRRYSIDTGQKPDTVDEEDRVAFVNSDGQITRTNTNVGHHPVTCHLWSNAGDGAVVRHEKFVFDPLLSARKSIANSNKTSGCFLDYLQSTMITCALK
ncbi:unnamed protein product [Echinostoma caproni]|uniref:Rieske domain-containing protein n=1 Tax=Echinostoma caproni TaxID=27848 RepID=A0A183AQ45_9TREM|nr:unnamed protein product [Echinostoma caproni]